MVTVRSFFLSGTLQCVALYRIGLCRCIMLLVESFGPPAHLMILATYSLYITHTRTPLSFLSFPFPSFSFSTSSTSSLFLQNLPDILFSLPFFPPLFAFSTSPHIPSLPFLLSSLLLLSSASPHFHFSSIPSSSSFLSPPHCHISSPLLSTGAAWHKACFKCGDGESLWGCNRGLTLDSYSQYGGWPFCKACYTKNFKQG
jgi:hypothetical protein